MNKKLFKKLEAIAKRYSGIQTLTQRNRDSLDFHDISVWSLTDCLEAAYKLGRRDTRRILSASTKGREKTEKSS